MTDRILLLQLFGIFVAFLKAADFIYLFQIKEYRFDRMNAMLNEAGLLNVFYLRTLRAPARKLRNVLLAIISITLIAVMFFSAKKTEELIITILLSPFLAFFTAAVGVYFTNIAAEYKRNRIIRKAQERLLGSKTKVIGITGSYGKTSVKEFLATILSQKFSVASTEANMNTDVGVALSILKGLTSDTDYFIAEMGAYRRGEIKKICDIVKPKYAILTAIGNQHLGLFGSREILIQTKSELIESLPKNGMAYVNKGIPEHKKITETAKSPVVYYTTGEKSDIYADEIHVSASTISATVHYRNHSFKIRTSLIGEHNILNLLPCIALAYDAGMTATEITAAIKTIKQPLNKLSQTAGINGSMVLSDSNNSSVDGFIAAIKAAKQFGNLHTYIVSKGIIELGDEKSDSYGRIIAELESITLLTTDRLFKELSRDKNVILFKDEDELAKEIKKIAGRNILIVVEGRFTKKFMQFIIPKYDLR